MSFGETYLNAKMKKKLLDIAKNTKYHFTLSKQFILLYQKRKQTNLLQIGCLGVLHRRRLCAQPARYKNKQSEKLNLFPLKIVTINQQVRVYPAEAVMAADR